MLAANDTYAVRAVDCLDLICSLEDESVDLIFADPPYNLSNGGTTCIGGKRVSVDKGDWDKSRGLMEDFEFHKAWLEVCQSKLKPTGSIMVSGTHHVIHAIGFAMKQLGYHTINDIQWCKPNPPPHLAQRYLTHSVETIIWASPFGPQKKGDKLLHTFNYKLLKAENGGKQMKDFWTDIPVVPQNEKKDLDGGGHPTQKPEKLLTRCILAATRPGDLVVDPFMGAGTTGAVAVRHGRRFIGGDLESNYVEMTTKRIEREIKRRNVQALTGDTPERFEPVEDTDADEEVA